MSTYMKRFASSTKKTDTNANIKKERTVAPALETAKQKSYRRHINRLVPPSETPAEMAPSTESRQATKSNNGTRPGTKSKSPTAGITKKLSTRRLRRVRNPSISSASDVIVSSGHQSEKLDTSNTEPPTTDSRVSPTKESKTERHSDNEGDDEVLEDVEKPNSLEPESSAPTSALWDEGKVGNNSMRASSTRSMLLEKENMQRELTEVQLDRDILRLQLLEAQTELETSRTSLRDQISVLENQLRTFQQRERRQSKISGKKMDDGKSKESSHPPPDNPIVNEDSAKQSAEDNFRDHNNGFDNGLLEQIRTLERDRESREEVERALRQQLKDMTEESKEAKSQAAIAEDRVRALQASIDASKSASSTRENAENEDISVQVNTNGNEKDQVNDIDTEGVSEVASLKKSYDTLKEDNNHVDSEQDRRKRDVDSSEKLFARSNNKNEVVHNLHLKLDEEMAKLKLRKERRRSRAVSATASFSTHRFRALGDSSSTTSFRRNEHKRDDVRIAIAPDISPRSLSEETSITGLPTNTSTRQPDQLFDGIKPTQSNPVMIGQTLSGSIPEEAPNCVVNYEKELKILNTECKKLKQELIDSRMEKETFETALEESTSEILKLRSLVSEKAISARSNEEDEALNLESNVKDEEKGALGKLEEKNIQLAKSLETVNNVKVQLEVQLQNAMQQVNESRDEVDKLNSEVTSYRSSLEQHVSEEKRLTELIESTKNETALQAHVTRGRSEQSSYERPTEMKEESNDKDGLERKILSPENDSKVAIESLLNERNSALEERKAVELKLRDTSKELDESKDRESVLEKLVQEISDKLEATQKELSGKQNRLEQASTQLSDLEKELVGRGISKTSENENVDFQRQIEEKGICITNLQNELSNKDRRLQQAAEQLYELEKELFGRDEEIDTLNAKRQYIEDYANRQLTEMQRALEQGVVQIDRLEEEKLKLQDSIQKYEEQIEKQGGRLAEASLQLSELESELFAKDDDIEEIELSVIAMHALEIQRLEALEDSENKRRDLEKQLASAKKRMEYLESLGGEIKRGDETSTTEARRLFIEDERKSKELQSSKNQLNRQLQNVSKLTELNDKWQLQLESASDEKQELIRTLTDATNRVDLLQRELEEASNVIKDLNVTNAGLKDDLDCATQEGDKNRRRISQMEEQKEALSEKLESAMDNLADLKKNYKESQEREEALGNDVIEKLQANLRSAQAVDSETEIRVRNLTEQLESERRSLQMTEVRRNELETENESLKNRIRLLIEFEFEKGDNAAGDDQGELREQRIEELAVAVSRRRESETKRLGTKAAELEEHMNPSEKGEKLCNEPILASLEDKSAPGLLYSI
ncbi:unnamed protein product [Pseudo-nitzschia multistriata]|uniref:Uncharacterized protein n=1 Tax=Pseudo-nitzschia multistriata TaxID=183589 RepID=A0A448Z3I5_9STRA|nr:unnamed protein product [Pseudo-nitzschia multistriata]